VTGRYNYTQCSHALFGDDSLVYRPEWLERAKEAAESAGWFWKSHNLNELADRNDPRAITMVVTGWDGTGDGMKVGFAQRCERLARAIMIL
jgi:putative chitinase